MTELSVQLAANEIGRIVPDLAQEILPNREIVIANILRRFIREQDVCQLRIEQRQRDASRMANTAGA